MKRVLAVLCDVELPEYLQKRQLHSLQLLVKSPWEAKIGQVP